MNRLITRGAITASAMLSILSCSDSTAPNGISTDDLSVDANRVISTIVVTFADSSIAVGDSTRASAIAYDKYGHRLSRTMTWSSSDAAVATVSDSGWVKGVAQGQAAISAQHNAHTGSATITVAPLGTQSQAPVASVSVALASSKLSVGQTTQATATTRDSAGNVLNGRNIAWGSSDSSVAIISSSGVVTGLKNGTANIIATSESKSGNAPITVQDTATPPPPPPPPPPPSSWNPNEPTGMTTLTDRAFDAMNETGWSDQHGGSGGGFAIAQDGTAPRSPSNMLRATFPAGYTSAGDGPGGSDFGLSSRPRTLYVSYFARVSTNWYGHDSGVNKEFYAYANGVPNVYFNLRCTYNGSITPDIALQDMAVGGTYDISPNLVPTARITRGQWYHIEVMLVGNSAGASDGTIDWWLNGTHIGSYKNLRFNNSAATWNLFHYTSIWGGVGGPNVPATMYKDWDDVYISGKN